MPLAADQIDTCTDVLLEAFRNEAFTRYWLDLSVQLQRIRYRRAARLKFLLQHKAGMPILVAVCNNQAAGVICLRPPGFKFGPSRIAELILNIPSLLPLLPGMLRARPIASAVKPPGDLPAPHWVLEAIAVAPQWQGHGIGRALLEQAISLCEQDSSATGMYLFTGDEPNRRIYERFGFELLEQRETNGFTSYHMFRQNTPAH